MEITKVTAQGWLLLFRKKGSDSAAGVPGPFVKTRAAAEEMAADLYKDEEMMNKAVWGFCLMLGLPDKTPEGPYELVAVPYGNITEGDGKGKETTTGSGVYSHPLPRHLFYDENGEPWSKDTK